MGNRADMYRTFALRLALVLTLVAEAAYSIQELRNPRDDSAALGCFLFPIGAIMFFRGLEWLFREKNQEVAPGVWRTVVGALISVAAYVLTTQW